MILAKIKHMSFKLCFFTNFLLIYKILIQKFRESKVNGLNVDDFIIDQVFYKSKDQTQIPMYIVHKKVFIKLICLLIN